MILDQLTLDGFRLHRRTDVALGPGLTAIVGANGSGKSTLLEGVTFALYGEQRGTKETLRGDDGAPYRVRLEFRLGDAVYAVERRPDRAFLARMDSEGETRIAEGLADTTRACVRLLGLSYEQFRNSFLAEQKGLAFLRFRSAAARQEEVARMLGLDRLRRAEALAAEARRAAGVEVRALAETVGDEAAIREAFREAEAAAKTARVELRVAKVEAERAQDAAVRDEPAGRSAETYLTLLSSASAAEEALRLAVESRKVAETALPLAVGEAREAQELAAGANRHAELLGMRPASLKAERARAEAEALDPGGTRAIETAAQALEEARDRWRRRREEAVAEAAAAREALVAAREALSEAGQGEEGAPCPVCGRPLGAEAHAWREELKARVAGAERREALSRSALDEPAPAEIARLEGLLRAAELRGSAEGVPTLSALEAELQALEPGALRAKAIAGADRRLKEAEARAIRAAEGERKALDTAQRAQAVLTSTGFSDAESARVALAQASASKTAAQAARLALVSAENALRSAERALNAADERLQEARARRDALREAKRQESLNGAVATEMRALRTALNGTLRPDLETRAGELLERMTAGRYRRVRLGTDFEPTVVDEETDRAVLSGGEEDVVALALRLALAELVQDRQGHALTLLMLDEAFGALDPERRQSLIDVLSGLRDRYAQVIVVTHIEDVAQIADRVLRVTRDATGAARVGDE